MIYLHNLPPKKAIPMLRNLQKGTTVKAFRLSWRKGTLQSIRRYGGSDVVYVKHDNNALPTMYYFSDLKIPRQVNLLGE